jgi:hypothetical protein
VAPLAALIRRANTSKNLAKLADALLAIASDTARHTRMCVMGFVRNFEHGAWTVVVEDDDRVAYAYLHHQGLMVGDVWLYNRGLSPQRPPWQEPRSEMPFLNSAQHVHENGSVRSPSPDDVSVTWADRTDSDPPVTVWIGNQPVAWLAPGAKPGWSALVQRDGPLARTRSA